MSNALLHEQGWNHQDIERQLAHAERNAVGAAYNYAERVYDLAHSKAHMVFYDQRFAGR